MNGKVMVSIAAIGVACVAVLAGIGYATYQGTSSSAGIDSEPVLTASVDIYSTEDNRLLDTALSVPADDPGNEVTIEGYYLKLTGTQGQNSSVRLWCNMGYSQSWVFIDRMYLTFDGSDTEYDFGVRTIGPVRTTGVPTDAITGLEDDVSNYFVIHIVYTNVQPTLDAQGEKYASFEGSAFVFAFDGADPLAH